MYSTWTWWNDLRLWHLGSCERVCFLSSCNTLEWTQQYTSTHARRDILSKSKMHENRREKLNIFFKKNSKHASWEMYYAVSKLGSTLREGSHSKTNMEPHWLMCTHEGVTRHVLHVNVPSESRVKGQVTFFNHFLCNNSLRLIKSRHKINLVFINCRFLSRVICLICVVWG